MQNGDDILHYTLVQDQLSCTTDVYFGRDSSAVALPMQQQWNQNYSCVYHSQIKQIS